MGAEGGLAITSEQTPLQTVKWMGQERERSYLTSEETVTSFTTVVHTTHDWQPMLSGFPSDGNVLCWMVPFRSYGMGAVDQALLFDFLFR